MKDDNDKESFHYKLKSSYQYQSQNCASRLGDDRIENKKLASCLQMLEELQMSPRGVI